MSTGWGLGTWFGGSKQQKDAPKKAILQLRSTLEMLAKREQHLQRQMDEQDAIARKNVSTNKNRMFFHLLCRLQPLSLLRIRQRGSPMHFQVGLAGGISPSPEH
jgi:hypothetical protein